MARFIKKRRQKLLYLTLLLIILLVALGTWWYFSRPSRKPDVTIPSKTSTTTTPQTSGNQSVDNTPLASSSQPTSTKSGAGSSSVNNNATLLAPWGQFVSNHNPGQNNSSTMEASVCNTSPGATCYIKFTSGNKTRTLDTKTADANGSIIWQWDATDPSAGFSAGEWQITAVAVLNGQTKSVTDSQPLVVQ